MKKKRQPAKLERCVKDVKKRGGSVSPYAVCKAALKKKNPSEAYQAGAASLRSAAARLGTTNLSPSIAQRDEWRHSWKEFMAGWNAEKRRKNPAVEADAVYEEFHGRPSEELIEIKTKVHFHKHLAGLGKLEALVIQPEGKRFTVRLAGFKGAVLATNEKKNQLFIEGGDQHVDLKQFDTEAREVVTLGKCIEIEYRTTKDHLGSEGGTAVYAHTFRQTNQDGRHVTVKMAKYPDVIYRVLDESLEFSGGSYVIRAEGIDK